MAMVKIASRMTSGSAMSRATVGSAPEGSRPASSAAAATIVLSCSATYGTTTASIASVANAPRSCDRPYRSDRRSTTLVTRWTFLMRTIFRSTRHQSAAPRVGPR